MDYLLPPVHYLDFSFQNYFLIYLVQIFKAMISRGVKLAVAVALCACIAGPFSFGNALSVDLKPNSEECVYIRSPGNSGEGGQNMLSGTFEVTAGGFLDINAAVYTPQGKRSVQAGEANVRAV